MTEEINVECDFTSESGEDGTLTMKMDTLHVTLPPLEAGYAYRIERVGGLAQVSARKIEEDDQ